MVNLGFDGENGMTIDAAVPDIRVTLSKCNQPSESSGDWYQCHRIDFMLAVQKMVIQFYDSADEMLTVNKRGDVLTFTGGHSIQLYGPNCIVKGGVPLPGDESSLLCSEFIQNNTLTLSPLMKPPVRLSSAKNETLLVRKDGAHHQIPSKRVSLKGPCVVGEITNENLLWVELLAEWNKRFCLSKMMLLYESRNLHFHLPAQMGQADVTGFQLITIDESARVTLRIANKQQEDDQEMHDDEDRQPFNKKKRLC